MFEFAIKETDSSVSVFILGIVGLMLKIRLMFPRRQWLAALLTWALVSMFIWTVCKATLEQTAVLLSACLDQITHVSY